MRLLVSVVNKEEALKAARGGAQIIDVKNPREGSLGANFPRVIREARKIVPGNVEVSATIGDLLNLPGTASLAALGAAVSGANYVKAGLFGVKTPAEALGLMKEVCRAVKDYDASCRVIVAGYADFQEIGCLNPLKLPYVAHKVRADGVMIDIKVKDYRKLFHFLSYGLLRKFISRSHKYDLMAALAGSLDEDDVPKVYSLEADVIGVRGAVCNNRDRIKGKLQGEMVRKFIERIDRCEN